MLYPEMAKPPKHDFPLFVERFQELIGGPEVFFVSFTTLDLPQGSFLGSSLREAKPGGFPLFSGKVQIVSRTLSGLFLVGAVNGPRKRKGTNRENPRTIPEQIGKIPEKSGKSHKGRKRTKKEGQVQIGNTPPVEPPPLPALDIKV